MRLTVSSGGILQARGITLPENKIFIIGRVRGVDLGLFNKKVSRRHATIELKDGKYVLVDSDSLNGTFVNDLKVTECVLKVGDTITICDFKITIEE